MCEEGPAKSGPKGEGPELGGGRARVERGETGQSIAHWKAHSVAQALGRRRKGQTVTLLLTLNHVVKPLEQR